jgi:DtxR family Mn-dependent transcriptional regulator
MPKQKGIMSGVVDHSPAFLQHLNKISLTLGLILELIERNEYDGSIEVKIGTNTRLHLSKEVAKNVLVKTK